LEKLVITGNTGR